jgi:branched-chain amino acid aminotransferase
MVRDGVAFTPQVTDDILEGVTRTAVMELLREEIGIPVVERAIDRTELYSCDELIMCGTAAQVVPVVEVDQRPVGDGVVGEIAQTLQGAYFDAVRGRDAKRSHWLTPVYPG